ncbi:MAG: 2,3-bisphosphoglycerate-independent phosphoglycerate mutase, partial [Bacilli bacterium]|nr:2,3-bisphosphoglycerate-independent phosphoglycerate mutase [Bacilli bacterium]
EMFTLLSNPTEYEPQANEKDLVVKHFNNLATMTMYPVTETVHSPHAFNDADMKNILVDYLHNNGLSQLRIAETEKYPHVTFFFDGGKEVEYDDMKKILIPSPKVATYDLKPEMSVYEVTDNFLKEVGNYDVTIMNFANGDMVGHTGVYEAAVQAVEDMDKCLDKVYSKIMELGGILIIIADHGNCDMMWDEDHKPVTSHTTNPVPCIITKEGIELNDGKLADIAPTMLELLGLPIPEEMTGNSLIK